MLEGFLGKEPKTSAKERAERVWGVDRANLVQKTRQLVEAVTQPETIKVEADLQALETPANQAENTIMQPFLPKAA